MTADLKALVLEGSLLDDSVAAALQFIAKSACLYAIERGDLQFNQSYFDCNWGLVKKVLHHARHVLK